MKEIKKEKGEMSDITLAIGGIFALGVIGVFMVSSSEVITVLSYVVTAIGSLATGHALK